MALKNSTRLSGLGGVEQRAATRLYQHLRLRCLTPQGEEGQHFIQSKIGLIVSLCGQSFMVVVIGF